METKAAAPRCQLLLIVLMFSVMLLPGTNGSLLLVQRTVTRNIMLQETISKVSIFHIGGFISYLIILVTFTFIDKALKSCDCWRMHIVHNLRIIVSDSWFLKYYDRKLLIPKNILIDLPSLSTVENSKKSREFSSSYLVWWQSQMQIQREPTTHQLWLSVIVSTYCEDKLSDKGESYTHLWAKDVNGALVTAMQYLVLKYFRNTTTEH
ncbi:hypothetical protein STEG23_033396 [Scotinomys teguina]